MKQYLGTPGKSHKWVKICFRYFLSIFFFLFALPAFAHTLPYDFTKLSDGAIGLVYFKMGFTHIIPLGADHILFILGIFLLKPEIKTVVLQATAFTIAHSITLILTIYGLISPRSEIIEPFIALSIVFIGIENIIVSDLKWWRTLIIFLFGLVHGCGFAGVLSESGLPDNNILTALLSFNAGVEAGQISVILIAYLIFGKWAGNKSWYRYRITIPASLCISLMALIWTIERIFY